MPAHPKSADRRTRRAGAPTLAELAARCRRAPRPKLFGDDRERLAEAVRIVRAWLAEQFDRAYLEGKPGWLLFRDSADAAAARWGLDLHQAYAEAVLPEVYGTDPDVAGLLPESGGKRVGSDRVIAFAEFITGRRGS